MEDLIEWLRAEIRKDIAGAEKLLEEGPERRWYDRYHCVYPRDLIARGTAELAMLAKVEEGKRGLDEALAEQDKLDVALFTGAVGAFTYVARTLASGYQNRPGFKPSWLD